VRANPRHFTTHDRHFLASRLPESFGPPNLPWVPLHLEVLVALGCAETERLGIVTDEHGTWIGGGNNVSAKSGV
jgi:hypothetical protein